MSLEPPTCTFIALDGLPAPKDPVLVSYFVHRKKFRVSGIKASISILSHYFVTKHVLAGLTLSSMSRPSIQSFNRDADIRITNRGSPTHHKSTCAQSK